MLDQVHPLLRWFIEDAASIRSPRRMVDAAAEQMIANGIPVWRYATYIRTLHPELMGDSYLWTREAGRSVHRTAPRSIVTHDDFTKSPIVELYRRDDTLRLRLDADADLSQFPVLETMRAEGGTDYCAVPLRFSDGSVHAATVATDAPGGFSDEQIALIEACAPLMARFGEHHAIRAMGTRLLNIYVGREAGARIMAGEIVRGTSDTIHAAIWLSDLRGFTRISDSRSRDEVVELLNAYFDCMAGPVGEHGGEVLKFVGDAMLAIFPISGERDRRQACRDALAAAQAALTALAGTELDVAAGIALHVGDVAYGNIGAADRLDFTVIGPAVNMADRIQSLCSSLEEPLLMSREFVEEGEIESRALDPAAVRGREEPLEIFRPS